MKAQMKMDILWTYACYVYILAMLCISVYFIYMSIKFNHLITKNYGVNFFIIVVNVFANGDYNIFIWVLTYHMNSGS